MKYWQLGIRCQASGLAGEAVRHPNSNLRLTRIKGKCGYELDLCGWVVGIC
jgi:hypothetical protein